MYVYQIRKLESSVIQIVLVVATVAIFANIIIAPSLKAYAFSQSADLNSDQTGTGTHNPPQQGTSERSELGSVSSSRTSPADGDSYLDESSRAQDTTERDRPPIQITNQIVVQIEFA